jgi:hypothetical protein
MGGPHGKVGVNVGARYVPGLPLDRAAALVAGMVRQAPPQLRALMNSVAAGHSLHLYSGD